MGRFDYVIDTGLKWANGQGSKRAKTDHIQIHHTVGVYDTPAQIAALHKRKITVDKHKGIGYTWIISRDGKVYKGRDMHYGHGGVKDSITNKANQRSVAIALSGDMRQKGLPTAAQLDMAVQLARDCMEEFGVPASQVLGHNEIPLYSGGKATGKFYPTLCPSLDMREFRALLVSGKTTERRNLRLTAKPYMRGSDVTDLQRLLLVHGFDPKGLDGFFGVDTDAALRLFQRAKGLPVDGVVNGAVWAALDAEPASEPEVDEEPALEREEEEVAAGALDASLPALYIYAGGSYVNVRSAAGASNKIVGRLAAGERCLLLSLSDGWAEVVLHTQAPMLRGWCIDAYLTRG